MDKDKGGRPPLAEKFKQVQVTIYVKAATRDTLREWADAQGLSIGGIVTNLVGFEARRRTKRTRARLASGAAKLAERHATEGEVRDE